MRTTFSKCAAALTMLALAAAGCGNGTDRRAAESRPESGAHGAEGDAVVLSAEAMRLAGIGISEIGRESIGHTIEMPGEIGYNEERRIHITPRYAGLKWGWQLGRKDIISGTLGDETFERNDKVSREARIHFLYGISSPGWGTTLTGFTSV